MKMNEELIAPCGLNCGVCIYYLSRVKGLYKSKKSGCIGCRLRDRGCHNHGGCEPIKTKTVRFCYECSDFPCENFKKLERRYSSKYHTSLIDNLQNIKEKGVTGFIAGEEKKWKCPGCGGIMSMHTWGCIECGRKQNV